MYYATAKEMECLDTLAVAQGLEIRQMMEIAGWRMVELFQALTLHQRVRIVIVCGKGNNGGDGLSAARHLINHGYTNVSIYVVSDDLKPDSAHHRTLLEKMNVPMLDELDTVLPDTDIIIDALLGYHIDGDPRDSYACVITAVNKADIRHVIAYDVPSGLHPDTGEPSATCIRATETLTLALPKQCFDIASAKEFFGDVYIADIGIPTMLYDQIASGSHPDFLGKGIKPLLI